MFLLSFFNKLKRKADHVCVCLLCLEKLQLFQVPCNVKSLKVYLQHEHLDNSHTKAQHNKEQNLFVQV